MAKKKQFVTAAAAFAVAASAVAPAITADAASSTVQLSSDYVRGGDLDAALDKEYKGSEIYWYKSSVDMNKLGVFQTAKGFVKGQGIRVEKRVRVLNYAQEIKPESEFVFEQGVPVSGIRIQPVLFADGNEYAKPLSVAGFNTDKVGEFEGTLTYANKAYGSVTKTVKYKVVASKVEFSEVKHEVKDDMLSVSADVKNLKDGEKVELVIFPGKDESKALAPITAEIKDGKVMVSAKDIPAGTHSFILRSGDVKTAAMEFMVEAPMVKEVKAINLKQVEVTFNKAVDESLAGITSNYELKKSDNSTLAISSAKVVDGKKVILTLSTAQSQSTDAKLTVKNLKDVNGKVIADTIKDVKFLDVVAPTVEEIKVVAPRVVRVHFSEPLQSAPSFKLNNGATAIVSSQLSTDGTYADLTIGLTPENGSTHTLNVVGGTDFATFKVESVDKSFVYAVDVQAPVAELEVVSATQVKVKFDKEVQNLTNGNVKFYHTTKASAYELVPVTPSSSFAKELVLNLPTGQKLAEGSVKVFVDYVSETGTKVEDKFGNKLEEVELSSQFVADKAAPMIKSTESKSSTTIDVTFDETVLGATNKANYVLKDAAGDIVAINDVQVYGSASNNTFRITTSSPLNGGNYSLTVKDITDVSLNKISEVTKLVAVADKVAPGLATTSVQLLADQKVKINFNEVMDKASIENKANYLVGSAALNSKVTATAVDGNKSVILDFSSVTVGDDVAQSSIQGKTIKVLRVADAAGNLITAPSTDVVVPGTATAPLFDKAVATGKNTVKLYFKELLTGAEANDFEVSVNGGTFTAAAGLTNEVIDGKSVLTLTTVDSVLGNIDTDVTNVKVQTAAASGVTAVNAYGTKASLTNVTVGDKFAPEIVGAVFTDNASSDDNLVVTFSEALYAASVQETDFAVQGRNVKAVRVANDGLSATLTLTDDEIVSQSPTKVSIVGTIEDTERNAKNAFEFTIATPAAPSVTKAKGTSAGQVRLTGSTTAMEYRIGNGAYTSIASADQSIAANIGDVISVRVKATSTMNAGNVTSLAAVVATDIKEAAAPSVSKVDETVAGANDGKITSVTDAMEYKLNSSNTWIAVPQNAIEITDLAPGAYGVRVKATTTQPASEIASVTIATTP